MVFQDECAVRLLPSISNSYAPIGCPSEIECDGKNKEYVSVSGVISPEGYSYFEVRIMEGFKQKGLTRFLDNAWANAPRNLLLVWDNASSHKSQTIRGYLGKQCKVRPRIWLENTPPYSPELNPIELAWAYLKKKLANQFAKDTFELKAMVLEELNKLKEDKEMIQSFFRHEKLNCYQFFT